MGGFDSVVRDMAISADGKMIAVCAYDGSVRTYRSDGTLLEAVNIGSTDGNWVETVAIGHNNTRLIVGCDFDLAELNLCKLSKK